MNGALCRPVLKRCLEVKTLLIGQCSLAVGVALIPFAAPNTPVLYIGLFLLALGTGLSNPALSSIVSRLAPTQLQGFALGTAQMISAQARIFGPLCLGMLYDTLRGASSLYVSSGLLVVGASFVIFGLQKTSILLQMQQTNEETLVNERI